MNTKVVLVGEAIPLKSMSTFMTMAGTTGAGMPDGAGITGTDLTMVGDGTLGMVLTGDGAGITGVGTPAGVIMLAGDGITGMVAVFGVLQIIDTSTQGTQLITEHTDQV